MSSDDHGTKLSDTAVETMFGTLFIFLGVAILLTIVKICFTYRLKHQQRRTTIDGVAQPPPTEPPRTGLDQSTIDLIPKFVYKPSRSRRHQLSQGGEEDIECSVCLSTIVEEATVRLLPNCKHLFHEDCIDVWLRSHMTCPICRAMVEPRLQPQAENDELGAAVPPTAPPLEESRIQSFGEVGAEDIERQ